MNKTPIEWVKNPDGTQGYTWNPITGCQNGCEYCYARKLANTRLRLRYLRNFEIALPHENPKIAFNDPFYPRFWEDRLYEIKRPLAYTGKAKLQKPRGIFVCDMGELFGDWLPKEWIAQVFYAIKDRPEHRFYLLTKQPQNLIKFSPFPDNCYVGVSVTDHEMYKRSLRYLDEIEAKIKYISFEPLLHRMGIQWYEPQDWGINWLIIGACTGTLNDLKPMAMKYPELALMSYGKRWTLQPKIEWVEEIVRAADKAGIPVFLEDNLMPLLRENLRQEMP